MNKKQILIKAAVVALFITFIAGMTFLISSTEKERLALYRIEIDGKHFWTKEVLLRDDGGLSFKDENSKRNIVLYGSYVIYQPENK